LQNYPRLEFNDLAAYKALGGHDYVENYYQKRSKAFGFPEGIPVEGMFYLMRMCLDADDISVFDFYMQKFKNQGLVANNNVGWNMNFADFYLKHTSYQKALAQYELIAQVYPDSPRPIHGMARAYQALGQNDQALKHYEAAVSIAKKSNSRLLGRYLNDLETFKKGG